MRESTWGVPALGALHVLGLGWFGTAVLRPELKSWRRAGFAFLLFSGLLLFWAEPMLCYRSTAFRIKVPLFLAASVIPFSPKHFVTRALPLWAAVVFLSRAIAFF